MLNPPHASASAELYDPAKRTWMPTTGNLNTGRAENTATLQSNGMVLVAGGSERSSAFASAELYDPASRTWTDTGSLITARDLRLALQPERDDAGCRGISTVDSILASAELYDPASGTWTPSSHLHTARADHTATWLPNGMLLVAGGYDSSFNPSNECGTLPSKKRDLDGHRQPQHRAR